MGMGGREKGREIDNIPMCANCAIACQNDDRDALVKRALRRIEVADGGLSWQRWKTRCKNKSSRSATAIAARQSHLGGDSSMDVVSSPPPDIRPPPPPPPPPSSPTMSSSTAEGKEGETLARLHYRRCRDPRFAKLECVVPFDAALYVSIFDPLNTPAFKPHPAKPLPRWMRLLPGGDRIREEISQQKDHHHHPCPEEEEGEEEEEERGEACWPPRSVLDVHFPPAATFSAARRTAPPQANDVRANSTAMRASEPGDERNGNGKEMVRPRARAPLPLASSPPPQPPSPPISPSPFPSPPPLPPPPPPQQQQRRRRKSNESTTSPSPDHAPQSGSEDSHGNSGCSTRSNSLLSDLGYPSTAAPPSSTKPIYKRPAIIADEPLRRPLCGFAGLRTYRRLDTKGGGNEDDNDDDDEVKAGFYVVPASTAAAAATTTTTTKPKTADVDAHRPGGKPNPMVGKGKGKTVAWDRTVAGGESVGDDDEDDDDDDGECCEPMPGDEARAESPAYAPRRCSSPLAEQVAAVWRRVVGARTPPAQSKEFLDLYRADDGEKKKKTGGEKPRFAHPSLAVPGRRREREMGGVRVCLRCGNKSTY
ncbi:hypothetical protein F4823DRAFT_417601 [Ustulina deusta]|nr:hypothetical protein F4823DRAFT_417601 [Ustulina deusta]